MIPTNEPNVGQRPRSKILYGPKPPQCPADFDYCGDCNVYPCLIGQPAIDSDERDTALPDVVCSDCCKLTDPRIIYKGIDGRLYCAFCYIALLESRLAAMNRDAALPAQYSRGKNKLFKE